MREVIDIAMPEAGIKPNVVTYSTLMDMLRKEGNDEAAKKVVEGEGDEEGEGARAEEKGEEILNYPARGEDLSKRRTAELASAF